MKILEWLFPPKLGKVKDYHDPCVARELHDPANAPLQGDGIGKVRVGARRYANGIERYFAEEKKSYGT